MLARILVISVILMLCFCSGIKKAAHEEEVRQGKLSLDQSPCTAYQRKVDVDMLNAVKSMLADVSSFSPSLL